MQTTQSLSRHQIPTVVPQQLQALHGICKQLSNSQSTSLQALFDLSWGIGSIPKEKKFSKKWSAVIPERQWLLLEDISRQMACKFPKYPNLSCTDTKEVQRLVSDFSESARILKTVFATLMDMENATPFNPSPKGPEKPVVLQAIENLFYADFDGFILDQVARNIQIVKASLGSQNPVEWLRADPAHVKALFRTIEVIGEASKILSEKARQQLPTLIISGSNKKLLWGKLRNQLHHNKKRSWDIANHAPEKWADLLAQLFPKLETEIVSYKNTKQKVPNSNTTQQNINDIEIIETLSKLCEQDQFHGVRRVWRQIETDFKTEPTQLKRILFGLESVVKEDRFLDIWKTHAKPNLKQEADAVNNQTRVLEMLRIGSRNLIQDTDIEKLTPSSGTLDKKTAVVRMKYLLCW